jgi:hypothetical protein
MYWRDKPGRTGGPGPWGPLVARREAFHLRLIHKENRENPVPLGSCPNGGSPLGRLGHELGNSSLDVGETEARGGWDLLFT